MNIISIAHARTCAHTHPFRSSLFSMTRSRDAQTAQWARTGSTAPHYPAASPQACRLLRIPGVAVACASWCCARCLCDIAHALLRSIAAEAALSNMERLWVSFAVPGGASFANPSTRRTVSQKSLAGLASRMACGAPPPELWQIVSCGTTRFTPANRSELSCPACLHCSASTAQS